MLPRNVIANTTSGVSEIKNEGATGPDAAQGLRLLLDLYGCEATVAYSGPEGVQAAEQYPPEVGPHVPLPHTH
jgi:hypothetical protein